MSKVFYQDPSTLYFLCVSVVKLLDDFKRMRRQIVSDTSLSILMLDIRSYVSKAVESPDIRHGQELAKRPGNIRRQSIEAEDNIISGFIRPFLSYAAPQEGLTILGTG